MTIYAQWTINSYTVAFNANGGVGDKTVTYNHGSTLGELSTPTREGYTFAGWFTAAYGYDAVTSETIVTSDMTIYAHWKKKYYRVAFETNSEVMSSLYAHGSTLGELTTPTREGYTFVGWFTAVEGGDAVTSETVVTSDMTIYAQWTIKSYTVVFNANGGVGDKSVTYNHGSPLGELPTPTRDGYAFAGWWTAANGGTQVTVSTVVSADMTIYAHWTIKSYAVVFDADGGNGGVTKSYTHGVNLGELPTPTRDGYKFLGWFTATEGGSAVTSETIVTADMTIYARWEFFDGHDKV
jgi:uncharacterized repeat protein (TIGR02543 family)